MPTDQLVNDGNLNSVPAKLDNNVSMNDFMNLMDTGVHTQNATVADGNGKGASLLEGDGVKFEGDSNPSTATDQTATDSSSTTPASKTPADQSTPTSPAGKQAESGTDKLPATTAKSSVDGNNAPTGGDSELLTPAFPKGKRDYSGLNEEETKWFKGTSNEAFAALKPAYLERKQLQESIKAKEEEVATLRKETGLPASYYEHPEAVKLSKPYRDNVATMQNMQLEASHWRKQILNMEKGEEGRDLVYDEKTGRYALGQVLQPTAENKFDLGQYYQRANAYYAEAEGKVKALETSFKERHGQAVSYVRNLETTHFPMFEDTKSTWAQQADKVYKSLPPELQNSPLTPLVTKMAVSLLALREEYDKVVAAKQTAVAIKEDQAKAGPTRANFAGTTPAKPAAPTMEDFMKLMG